MANFSVPISKLRRLGIEAFSTGSSTIELPVETRIEAPAGLKWTRYEGSLDMGAFSYQVSGYCCAARIGRYCSIGEDVQIGRQNHPQHWVSTSPAFYEAGQMFDLDDGFRDTKAMRGVKSSHSQPPAVMLETTIGHDVWIGHGAYIAAGVTIGHGAIIGARSVVTKDVPPYAVVAGNPAGIKKYRLMPELISPVLTSRWWRFAPWQLDHLDPCFPGRFVTGLLQMQDEPEFQPKVFTGKSRG